MHTKQSPEKVADRDPRGRRDTSDIFYAFDMSKELGSLFYNLRVLYPGASSPVVRIQHMTSTKRYKQVKVGQFKVHQ